VRERKLRFVVCTQRGNVFGPWLNESSANDFAVRVAHKTRQRAWVRILRKPTLGEAMSAEGLS